MTYFPAIGTRIGTRCFLILLLACLAFLPAAPAHQDPQVAGYVEVDGGRIWYRLNGAEHLKDKPAIIVMHGGPGGTHRGNMTYVALADSYPVILYDQLGTGNSDRPNDPANWRVERFVAEIDHLREALDLESVIIAGHSWGGTLAAEYAVRNPPGLRAAILSSPLINTPQWIADNQKWIEQLPVETKNTIRAHESAGTTQHEDYREAEKSFYARHMCRQDPCPNRQYREGGPEMNKQMYETMWGPTEFYAPGLLQDYDVSARLPDITVPTLMICGEYDEAAPASGLRYADMIPDSMNIVIPDAGHATMAENEALYLESLRLFLGANGL